MVHPIETVSVGYNSLLLLVDTPDLPRKFTFQQHKRMAHTTCYLFNMLINKEWDSYRRAMWTVVPMPKLTKRPIPAGKKTPSIWNYKLTTNINEKILGFQNQKTPTIWNYKLTININEKILGFQNHYPLTWNKSRVAPSSRNMGYEVSLQGSYKLGIQAINHITMA